MYSVFKAVLRRARPRHLLLNREPRQSQSRVNALNGLTSISTIQSKAERQLKVLYQCPQRAYFHFYGSLSEPLILLASESYFYK